MCWDKFYGPFILYIILYVMLSFQSGNFTVYASFIYTHHLYRSGSNQPFTKVISVLANFLSWQTWDLMRMRICWYGFKEYCQEFLTSHPGYFVLPLRLNGSAIETIFSQLKHASRGSLTAVTYESARAQLLEHTWTEYMDRVQRCPPEKETEETEIVLYRKQCITVTMRNHKVIIITTYEV